MPRNFAFLVAISQPETFLQQSFDCHWKLGGRGGSYLNHLATSPDQVFQAALMRRLRKAIETPRSVMHQKTGVSSPRIADASAYPRCGSIT